jgi:hypothetical protein
VFDEFSECVVRLGSALWGEGGKSWGDKVSQTSGVVVRTSAIDPDPRVHATHTPVHTCIAAQIKSDLSTEEGKHQYYSTLADMLSWFIDEELLPRAYKKYF